MLSKMKMGDNSQDEVNNAFLNYYMKLLGTKVSPKCTVKEEIIRMGPVLSETHKNLLSCEFTLGDVRQEGHIFNP